MSRALLAVLVAFLLGTLPSSAESPACLSVYNEGGAPAVFRSPKCPRWAMPDNAPRPPTSRCQVSVNQGRRKYQVDRALCAHDVKIPFLGPTGINEASVSVVAVFDGHNGAEASDLASKVLLDYFLLHVQFLLDEKYFTGLRKSAGRFTYDAEQNVTSDECSLDIGQSWSYLDPKRFKGTLPATLDDNFHVEILKESLLRTIHDIDATFSKEASMKNLEAGSTATIVLIANGQILAANVGDSKSLVCSEYASPISVRKGLRSRLNRQRRQRSVLSSTEEYVNLLLSNSDGLAYYVKELTKDHHPDRDDERQRIESCGGHVVEWAGVHRVNGQLAVSRSIGDILFKNYGVIPTPEVTDWKCLTTNDSYVVAASDGIFDKMTPQEVCDLLWEEKLRDSVKSIMPDFIPTTTHSLADRILITAFERGSMDNMAVVVLPLERNGISGTLVADDCDQEENVASPFGQQEFMEKNPANLS